MQCSRCKNKTFKIEIKCCSDCTSNGWYYPNDCSNGYRHSPIPEGIERLEVQEEGKCEFGNSYDCGCYMFTCTDCDAQHNLELMEE